MQLAENSLLLGWIRDDAGGAVLPIGNLLRTSGHLNRPGDPGKIVRRTRLALWSCASPTSAFSTISGENSAKPSRSWNGRLAYAGRTHRNEEAPVIALKRLGHFTSCAGNFSRPNGFTNEWLSACQPLRTRKA